MDEDDRACDAEAIVARETRTSNQSVDAAVLVNLNGDSPAQPFKDQQPNNARALHIFDDLGALCSGLLSRQKSHPSKFLPTRGIVDAIRRYHSSAFYHAVPASKLRSICALFD